MPCNAAKWGKRRNSAYAGCKLFRPVPSGPDSSRRARYAGRICCAAVSRASFRRTQIVREPQRAARGLEQRYRQARREERRSNTENRGGGVATDAGKASACLCAAGIVRGDRGRYFSRRDADCARDCNSRDRPNISGLRIPRARRAANVGKTREETFVIRQHGGDARLLQHDFGEPDAIGSRPRRQGKSRRFARYQERSCGEEKRVGVSVDSSRDFLTGNICRTKGLPGMSPRHCGHFEMIELRTPIVLGEPNIHRGFMKRIAVMMGSISAAFFFCMTLAARSNGRKRSREVAAPPRMGNGQARQSRGGDFVVYPEWRPSGRWC